MLLGEAQDEVAGRARVAIGEGSGFARGEAVILELQEMVRPTPVLQFLKRREGVRAFEVAVLGLAAEVVLGIRLLPEVRGDP